MRFDSKLKAHVGYVDAVEQLAARLRELGLKTDDPPPNERKWPHNLLVSYDGAREYQKEGIDFLINQAGSGALLCDDMGVGKSYQTVKAVRALRRKTIIVCEAHVRGVWEREPEFDDKGGEVARWWPKAEIFKPYKIKPTPIPPKTDVVVIHYDIIYAWVDTLLEWGTDDLTIVFDELQMLLNPTSRRSKACRALAHVARGRIGLSGTPPVEKVKNLHNAVDTICPGRFGEFFPFCMRHANAKQIEVEGPEKTRKLVWTFDGKSNLKELRQRLDWFCLRRTKREVMKELPALQRQIVDVEVPPKHRIALNARLVGDKRKMRMALDSAADGKFKHVLALIQSHLESGQRVVVATYRRAVCEKICDAMSEIAPTKFIHGGVPLTRRNKIIAELRRVEGPCCLVANIDCTATGIDLTFANVGVIAELVWEPRDLVQWEARAHRFGASTEEPVLMQYVIARGTGDELILHAVINKLDNFLDLVETDAGDGLKEALVGKKDEGLSRLAAALKKIGKKGSR
jgi:SNF2 family DNA or RNA helicase